MGCGASVPAQSQGRPPLSVPPPGHRATAQPRGTIVNTNAQNSQTGPLSPLEAHRRKLEGGRAGAESLNQDSQSSSAFRPSPLEIPHPPHAQPPSQQHPAGAPIPLSGSSASSASSPRASQQLSYPFLAPSSGSAPGRRVSQNAPALDSPGNAQSNQFLPQQSDLVLSPKHRGSLASPRPPLNPAASVPQTSSGLGDSGSPTGQPPHNPIRFVPRRASVSSINHQSQSSITRSSNPETPTFSGVLPPANFNRPRGSIVIRGSIAGATGATGAGVLALRRASVSMHGQDGDGEGGGLFELSPEEREALHLNPLLWVNPAFFKDRLNHLFAHYCQKEKHLSHTNLARLAQDCYKYWLQDARRNISKQHPEYKPHIVDKLLQEELKYSFPGKNETEQIQYIQRAMRSELDRGSKGHVIKLDFVSHFVRIHEKLFGKKEEQHSKGENPLSCVVM